MTLTWDAPVPITGRIEYEQIWTTGAIGVWIDNGVVPIWRKAGYLRIEVRIDGEWFVYRVVPLDYGKNLIYVPYRAFRAIFEPLDSLLQLQSSLTIAITEIGTEIMSINYAQVDEVTGDVVSTTFAPNTTSAQALGVDGQRRSGTIYNRTNRTIYVNWGTAAATATSLAVPAGANLSIPEDYIGAVQIIRAAGALTGDVLIQTLSSI
jgi:hypothetical protein